VNILRLPDKSDILGYTSGVYIVMAGDGKILQTRDFREYRNLASFDSHSHAMYMTESQALLISQDNEQQDWMRYNQALRRQYTYSLNQKYRRKFRFYALEKTGN